uniref:Uncharacterized protein n=1 Tax=Spumella elongata TaxID=89044 RepID=A0A7S3M0W4_9STRA|mmetsp:Transcript_19548/g.33918  ORF Transcript_19548/g.33918 Transcript_19548/m.33918 type:complete len:175 (+) Transcript_19548:76-600(+)|eukprot:CAMPEP_0184979778 /NCGR_PEP_ID=MMETSP1098-20130426/9919_1 /TAXON_ID=89044 /ORGANISM="Spumella elongata, Strain CCAP 955/1" /LENGTH=174 /DNA_ID=CAMNT_0027503111 /DNA_START=56 /DNA_END=580 /DNA_ORIENTATION=+
MWCKIFLEHGVPIFSALAAFGSAYAAFSANKIANAVLERMNRDKLSMLEAAACEKKWVDLDNKIRDAVRDKKIHSINDDDFTQNKAYYLDHAVKPLFVERSLQKKLNKHTVEVVMLTDCSALDTLNLSFERHLDTLKKKGWERYIAEEVENYEEFKALINKSPACEKKESAKFS